MLPLRCSAVSFWLQSLRRYFAGACDWPMSRFWPDGLPIAVQSDDLAAPTAFTFERAALQGPQGTLWRAMPRHRVERIIARWCVDTGWWQRRVWREYFTLTTTSGMLVTIYTRRADRHLAAPAAVRLTLTVQFVI